ncbi:hypothetical protein FGO68_gene8213 [Halteria grandinella]|uniref:Uncharacterized protein n=1 Tax=Halteria grandinella TaxID=5974 RepID=A0A8J8NFA0_HALGN|nr:hypothetical protein FGO68_gene8213 [Halteria grandinella]
MLPDQCLSQQLSLHLDPLICHSQLSVLLACNCLNLFQFCTQHFLRAYQWVKHCFQQILIHLPRKVLFTHI